MIEFKKYKGFLFVGDPHLTQKRTRKRNDIDLCTTILNKIDQAVQIELDENLYLVFLGDLFDDSGEQDIRMLTRLTRILNKLPHPPVTAEGNHEKTQTKLSDEVALKLLQESKTIHVIEKNGIWAKFNFYDKIVYLGSTPYGDKIPQEVNLTEKQEAGSIVWLTHDNFDFGDSYPGVIPLKEIKGVDMLINGHIHQTKKSFTLGKMRAHNPGNITRQTTDTIDHVPSVWKWIPEQIFELEPIVLTYEKEVFSMLAHTIDVDQPRSQIVDELSIQQTSQFVDKMEELQHSEPNITQDASHLRETIKLFSKGMKVDEEFTKEILELLDESLIENS